MFRGPSIIDPNLAFRIVQVVVAVLHKAYDEVAGNFTHGQGVAVFPGSRWLPAQMDLIGLGSGRWGGRGTVGRPAMILAIVTGTRRGVGRAGLACCGGGGITGAVTAAGSEKQTEIGRAHV